MDVRREEPLDGAQAHALAPAVLADGFLEHFGAQASRDLGQRVGLQQQFQRRRHIPATHQADNGHVVGAQRARLALEGALAFKVNARVLNCRAGLQAQNNFFRRVNTPCRRADPRSFFRHAK